MSCSKCEIDNDILAMRLQNGQTIVGTSICFDTSNAYLHLFADEFIEKYFNLANDNCKTKLIEINYCPFCGEKLFKD